MAAQYLKIFGYFLRLETQFLVYLSHTALPYAAL
jgi:hypothetical protein